MASDPTQTSPPMSTPHQITQPAYRPNVMGRNGAVTSGHPLASQAGIRILQAGGTAIDAAIATAAAIGVVELPMSGVGGDGFIMCYDAATKRMYGVNATGPAPTGATRAFYLERGGIPMKGILSVSIPGIVDGWLIAHRQFGRLPLIDVFGPAIELCEQGFPVSYKLSNTLKAEHDRFGTDPYTKPIFEPDGRPLEPGEILYQHDLGTTLRRIATEGRRAFYEGEIAETIATFSREYDGLITAEDLARYRARWDEPIHVDYHGHRVYEMPPNSSGHILLQELNLVEHFDIAGMGCLSADSIHVMVEAKKLAFADRERHMADPDWIDVPIGQLLSKDYAAERAKEIDLGKAAGVVESGIPESKDETTCFTTADGDGNAVCILQSIQGGCGSSLIAGNTGILLNNRMTYWHLEEGHPNDLASGKRVRHTMNPVIATRVGEPVIVCGTPGADTQVQTNLQLLTNAIHFDMTPQEAVEAPRWRNLQNPMESTVPHTCEERLQMESRFNEATLTDLEKRGHKLEILGDWGGPGNAQFIRRRPDSGVLLGGVDPRRDGYAIAW
ncbi:MAG: gamma-glutamyltransferase [Gemmatimonadetes bacterium]|nr:gamma-glutamyltransferase [Gemmatimonadota bacterium]